MSTAANAQDARARLRIVDANQRDTHTLTATTPWAPDREDDRERGENDRNCSTMVLMISRWTRVVGAILRLSHQYDDTAYSVYL